MTIRFAESGEYGDVLAHYQECNYKAGINDGDIVLIADDNDIVGAVRICAENGFKVLRGMQVKPTHQRKGIGRSMLLYLADHLDMSDCYCLPYTHLKDFYGTIGFSEITPGEAPGFLAERFQKYLSTGYDVTVMKLSKSSTS